MACKLYVQNDRKARKMTMIGQKMIIHTKIPLGPRNEKSQNFAWILKTHQMVSLSSSIQRCEPC